MMRLLATSATAIGLAVFATSCGSTTATTGPSHTEESVDSTLCSFPLHVTLKTTTPREEADTVNKFALTGPTAITLRNGSTGKSVTLNSSGASAKDTKTGTVTFKAHEVWFWDQDNPIPFLATDGETRFLGSRLQPAGTAKATVIDPCALVSASKPSTTPATTRAPWGLPQFVLSRMADARLPPVIGSLVRHDHAHLDVIVNGDPITVPGGIGQAEPVDTGPCKSGGPLFGDCRTHHFWVAFVAYSPLHTHGSSGLIHIESDRTDTYTLGQFFDEWGVRLTSSCIGGYCAGGGNELDAYVNGKLASGDPAKIVLTNKEEIALVFGDPNGFHGVVPSRYTGGWPGLGCGGPGEISC